MAQITEHTQNLSSFPTDDPIVTSKSVPSFLIQVEPLKNKSERLAWYTYELENYITYLQ